MLDDLKLRLGLSDTSKDSLLNSILTSASVYVKSYTGRKTIPAALEPAVVWIAAAEYNQLGLEGESSHTEGQVHQTIDLMPKHIRDIMNMYRVVKVG